MFYHGGFFPTTSSITRKTKHWKEMSFNPSFWYWDFCSFNSLYPVLKYHILLGDGDLKWNMFKFLCDFILINHEEITLICKFESFYFTLRLFVSFTSLYPVFTNHILLVTAILRVLIRFILRFISLGYFFISSVHMLYLIGWRRFEREHF